MDRERLTVYRVQHLLQSAALLAALAGLLCLLGWILFGPAALVWFVLLGVAVTLVAAGISPAVALKLHGAREIPLWQAPELHALLQILARRAHLPHTPRLYYLPSPVLNAFAVGSQRQAVITLTDGLLRSLTSAELAGVLAHEVSHVRRNDMWIMSLADMVGRMILVLAQVGLLSLFLLTPILWVSGKPFPWLIALLLMAAPALSALLQLALSRTREFAADLGAAELTGEPRALAAALVKIEQRQGRWFERLLLPGGRTQRSGLLRTHPTTSERVGRLLTLAPHTLRFSAAPVSTKADWKILHIPRQSLFRR